MKKNLFILGLLGILGACSNPDKEFIEKIKLEVKKDAFGLELNYKNISFEWTDTLIVSEKVSEFEMNYQERLDLILNLEYYVKDNYKNGKLFSLTYLTKNRLEELRNWEKNNRGIPFNKEYNDYYQFAFSNRNASKWISELCDQIEETDRLLNEYDKLEEGNLQLIKNVLWYYNRIDNYRSNHNPNEIWGAIFEEINLLEEINSKIDSLTIMGLDKVIHYRALNTYKINNPIFNGAEQELKKYFLFDSNLNIIGKVDFEK
jgi:hypothetical protein